MSCVEERTFLRSVPNSVAKFATGFGTGISTGFGTKIRSRSSTIIDGVLCPMHGRVRLPVVDAN